MRGLEAVSTRKRLLSSPSHTHAAVSSVSFSEAAAPRNADLGCIAEVHSGAAMIAYFKLVLVTS